MNKTSSKRFLNRVLAVLIAFLIVYSGMGIGVTSYASTTERIAATEEHENTLTGISKDEVVDDVQSEHELQETQENSTFIEQVENEQLKESVVHDAVEEMDPSSEQTKSDAERELVESEYQTGAFEQSDPLSLEELIGHTVTIDPNGGSIDEQYRSTTVAAGENYVLPYAFTSKLAKEGYSLTGYIVSEGILKNAKGETVTGLSRFKDTYTPQSDVTLTAQWKVTEGGVRIQLYDNSPVSQTDLYSLKLVSDDGKEYPLISNVYTSQYRTWKVDGVPNGTYTLKIEGFTENITIEKVGASNLKSESAIASDTDPGKAELNLEFVDDQTSAFVRYEVKAVPKATVTFAYNKLDTGVELPDPMTVIQGAEIQLPSVDPDITEKYSFLGWDTDGDNKIDAQPGDAYVVNSDVTIKGIWEGNYGKIGIVFHTEEYRGYENFKWHHIPLADLTGYDVKITNANGNTIPAKEIGNTKGKFYFSNLPKGDYKFEITTPDGFKVVKVVDGNFSKAGNIIEFEGDTITLPFLNNNLSLQKTLYVQVEEDIVPSRHIMLDGFDLQWTKGSTQDLVFVTNGNCNTFARILVDGIEITADDYSIAEGSIVVTLKDTFLETLSLGQHNLEVVDTGFTEGYQTASSAFMILADTTNTDATDPVETDTTETTIEEPIMNDPTDTELTDPVEIDPTETTVEDPTEPITTEPADTDATDPVETDTTETTEEDVKAPIETEPTKDAENTEPSEQATAELTEATEQSESDQETDETEEKTKATVEIKDKDDDAPKTGEEAPKYILAMALIALAGMVVLYKRRFAD